MANNDLPIRFTEEYYASKSDVARELKMSIIDSIWSNIKSYRSNFNHYLPVKSIDRNQFVFCFCSSIEKKIEDLKLQFIKISKDYSLLNKTNGDNRYFRLSCLTKCLSSLAEPLKLNNSVSYIKEIINGSIKNATGENKTLICYLKALEYIENNYNNPIDIDFLAKLYSLVSDNDELTTFYRSVDDSSPENKILIDRVYTCAPAKMIEMMMDELLSFVSNHKLDAISKSMFAYYFINYVKPFPSYNEEIAFLFAKAVLAHFELRESAILIPMESLLLQNSVNMGKIYVEVQKTNDVTYFLTIAFDNLKKDVEYVLDELTSFSVKELKNDFYKEDSSSPASIEVETSREEKPEVVEEKPVVETVIKPANVAKETKTNAEHIAVSYIPPVLDEAAAKRLEEHLLELEPLMKKGEAYFYARHCTLDKMYTIQQYKKALGCAYETARTSMDHLAQMGYYKEKMVKNKKVYTPIPRK